MISLSFGFRAPTDLKRVSAAEGRTFASGASSCSRRRCRELSIASREFKRTNEDEKELSA